ncbi:hypothetical protein GGR16_002081 [Chelatococcus caeni]|uniref:Uncharacterized protein n=1 Tax=Chelatococcus caeni TaxID=1348468 RepID=A0A840BZA9_9HYPH|nr:hypothetical protein [Chelatococcus caeni]
MSPISILRLALVFIAAATGIRPARRSRRAG